MPRNRKLPRFLSLEEMKRMIAVSERNMRDNMIIRCLFYLGLRNSELQKLQVDDIDFINRTVKVVQGKGNKDRYVPIPSRKFAGELRELAGKRTSGPLIKGRGTDSMLSDRHIRRIVKRYAIEAGIRKPEEIHPHTLRHSYATYLQNQGIPLNAIQQILGHENIETTTIYLHLGTERIRDLVEKAFKL
jgi:site-specific recombinase XerD